MLQCPRPYFWVIGSWGSSGWGDVLAESSLICASLEESALAVVRDATFSAGDVSFGQPTPTGQPMIPRCLAYPEH
jgi:hypothetical protein